MSAVPGTAVPPSGRQCLSAAQEHVATEPTVALQWLARLVDAEPDFAAWTAAAGLLDTLDATAATQAVRTARVGIVGSATTNQLTGLLRLAALRYGVWLEVLETGYDQYRQQILDPDSELFAFEPDIVLLAVHDGAVQLPDRTDDAAAAVESEIARWSGLWRRIADRCGADVVQHLFAVRPDTVHSHLAPGTRRARSSMLADLNRGLAERAGAGVSLVDCDALAAGYGKARWFDDRYWHISKQPYSLGALPIVARHTAAVLAARLGLMRRVMVLDLDNTLWGGVIGDDGLAGIVLGPGSMAGEAHAAFQRWCVDMARRGIVLAVCSKNDEETALQPFRQHPDMVLAEDDIAVFVANWEPKADNLRRIASRLGLGLDSLVFVDDNPAERDSVRAALPMVEVVDLPADPARYIDAVAGSLLFESAQLTDEDLIRARAYRARATAEAMREESVSIEDFHRDLEMTAAVAPIDEVSLPRVVQLIGKTNQFNLTTRRHGEEAVRRFMTDADSVSLAVRLQDRLADHGLVAAVIATTIDDALDIDTWVMSCRVIGRTLERTMLAHLIEEARRRGLNALRGTYIPTARNGLVSGLYEDLGFRSDGGEDGTTRWTLDVPTKTPRNETIKERAWVT